MLAWLNSPGFINLAAAVLAVALYLLAQHFAARVRRRDTADAPPAERAAYASAAQPGPSGAKPAATAAQSRGPLGSDDLSRAGHAVFCRYPTVSVDCRALFAASDADAVEDGVDVHRDALRVLREACHVSKVYLLLHDSSAHGILAAIVRSALDAEGVLGGDAGQVAAHRFLVCTTTPGKVAIVRQLEAAQHVECDGAVHEELSRFGVQQWLVRRPGLPGSLVHKVQAQCNQ